MTAMMMATATMMPRTAVLTMMTSPAALLPSPAALLTFLPAAALRIGKAIAWKICQKQGETTTTTQTCDFNIILPKELRPLPCQGKKNFLGGGLKRAMFG